MMGCSHPQCSSFSTCRLMVYIEGRGKYRSKFFFSQLKNEIVSVKPSRKNYNNSEKYLYPLPEYHHNPPANSRHLWHQQPLKEPTSPRIDDRQADRQIMFQVEGPWEQSLGPGVKRVMARPRPQSRPQPHHMAYFWVHSLAVALYFPLSFLKIFAISGTSGSSGLGSQRREQTERSSFEMVRAGDH